MICSNALNSREKPAVSPMSDSSTFDIDKWRKKQKRGEFATPPRPTGRRSSNNDQCMRYSIAIPHSRLVRARGYLITRVLAFILLLPLYSTFILLLPLYFMCLKWRHWLGGEIAVIPTSVSIVSTAELFGGLRLIIALWYYDSSREP